MSRYACMMMQWMAVFAFTASLNPAYAEEKPEIFVQMGHSGAVNSIAFSSDGKYLVSGGADKLLKLWEVSTGREVRTWRAAEGINSVALSPDGAHVVSAGFENLIRLWDVQSGSELTAFRINTPGTDNDLGNSLAVAFSPDGRYVAADCSEFPDGETELISIKIYDGKSGKVVRVLKGHSHWISSVVFSPDGRYLASGSGWIDDESKDNTVRLWDVRTGKEMKRFAGHTRGVMSVAFSPDGAYLASASCDSTVILWNVKEGKKERTFKNLDQVKSIAFSPDGTHLVAGTTFGALNLWDVSTGRNTLIHRVEGGTFNAVAFSPDGRHIAAGVGEAVLLCESASGVEERRFGGDVISPGFAFFSRDGKAIRALGRVHGENMSVDLLRGTIAYGKRQAQSPFSDGRYFAETEQGERFKTFAVIVDSKADKEIWRIDRTDPSNKFVYDLLAFSNDGRLALVSDSDRVSVMVFDVDKRTRLATLRPLEGWSVRSAVFSPDGRSVVTVSQMGGDNAMALWNVSTGEQLRTFDGLVKVVTYTSDGKYLLSGDLRNTSTLWNPLTGKRIRTFKGHSDVIESIGLSTDDKLFLSGCWDGTVKLWDLATGRNLQTFKGHTNWVHSVAFSLDASRAVSASSDGTARLWDISAGKEIAEFVSFKDGEWVIITPEGYFNASPNGARHLNVRVGNSVYSIDNFYEKFFNPVYVASVLQGRKVEAVADIRKGFLAPPEVKILSPDPGREFNTDVASIVVSAKDMGGGIDEIRLYHNGKAIGEETRGMKIVPKGEETLRTYTVTLVDGMNTFRATAFSKDRTESNPYELIVKLAAPQKDVSMYLFAVGINKYKNPALNLNYAEPDARGIVDFFRKQGGGLFKSVDILETYNEQATKETIVSKLDQLRSTKPQDAVLLYLAGHGENINDKWYFIPYELTYPEREEDVRTKGISSDELRGYVNNIKAQKILLLIDACKSGAVVVAFRGFEDRKALSQLSRSTGMYVVAASAKDQFAAEVKDLGHGVFTYVLLEGLKGKAAGKGEPVTVLKLISYVSEQLPIMTKKYNQEEQYPVMGSSQGMDFPLVMAK